MHPRSRRALMIRPIQTKIGHDQTHPDDNLPWSDFGSFFICARFWLVSSVAMIRPIQTIISHEQNLAMVRGLVIFSRDIIQSISNESVD